MYVDSNSLGIVEGSGFAAGASRRNVAHSFCASAPLKEQ